MKVVFNALSTLRPKTGVGHYAAQLSAAIAQLLPANEMTIFPGPRLSRCLRTGGAGNGPPSGSRNQLRQWLAQSAKSIGRSTVEAMFRWQCRPQEYALYHEPNFLPMPSDIPTIVTVHDLSVVLHPEWHPVDRVQRHESMFHRAVQQAAHVITVSESVRRDVIRHLGVTSDKVTAIHNGIGREFFDVSHSQVDAARRHWKLPENYLLFCGTIEPRKNLDMLLQAYCDLPGELRNCCPLIIAGGWGWKSDAVAELYEAKAKHCNVRMIGYVKDTHRPGLFAGARALLFPSHFEGFGLPPVEMLAAGGAVIASDIPVHHEVLGSHAEFVAPLDRAGWSAALRQAILHDDWRRQFQPAGIYHVRRYDWNNAARETMAIYRCQTGQKLARAA